MPSPLFRCAFVLAAGLLPTACTLPHRIPTAAARPAMAPSPVPVPTSIPATPITRIAPALPDLPKLPEQSAPPRNPAMQDVDGFPLPELPQLPPQAGTGTAPGREPATTSDAVRARAALADLAQRVRLDDDQLHRVKSAQAALARGDAATAATLAIPLDERVRRTITRYTTAAGETLRSISAQVYHNGDLWPLIWQANRPVLPDPDALRPGQVLTIPTYPTLDQVADALQYAHRHAASEAPQGENREPRTEN